MLQGRLRGPLAATAMIAACACGAPSEPPRAGRASPAEPSPPVADLHVDLAFAIAGEARSVSGDGAAGGPKPQRAARALDHPDSAASVDRLRRGGVELLVIPLFVPDADALSPAAASRAYEETYTLLDAALKSSGAFSLPGEAASAGRIATVLAFEGADGLEGDPAAIQGWIRRGACLFGLVHQRTNRLAGSSQDPARARRAEGLSAAGEAVAEAVYAGGGLVDVAHASDAAFDDIARIARRVGAPIVDSHTGVRALVDIDRNIDDSRLRAVAESGGAVGIDLHSGHVSKRPGEAATLDDVADHIVHAARIAGIDHVAIGSDFEGGIEPPTGADGEATWPRLAAVLRSRGWTAAHIEAVFAGNARRVLGVARARGCGRT
jgi:membrane dipeptidase